MNETVPQLIEDFKWMTAPVAGGEHAIPWMWIAVGSAVFAVLVFVLVSRWRKGKKVLPFLAPPPPHVQALAALRGLEALMEPGREKEFVAEVSRIARVYIQGRFGLRAPHRSTEEFLWEAGQSRLLTLEHQELLTRFLMHCDLVKFARQNVVVDEMRELLESARGFVAGTIPETTTAEKKRDSAGKQGARPGI